LSVAHKTQLPAAKVIIKIMTALTCVCVPSSNESAKRQNVRLCPIPRISDENCTTKRALGRAHLPPTKVDGSVNKTILKPRLPLAARRQYVYVGFSRRKNPRIAAQLAGSLGKDAKFCSLYDIAESNPVPGSGLWSGSGSKVNQFVHVPTSVDTQHFIQIHARVFSNLAS